MRIVARGTVKTMEFGRYNTGGYYCSIMAEGEDAAAEDFDFHGMKDGDTPSEAFDAVIKAMLESDEE